MGAMLRGCNSRVHRVVLAVLCLLAPLLAASALAWACGPSTAIDVNPNEGVPGDQVTVNGGFFQNMPVEIRWNSAAGPVLATSVGPAFSVAITIPDVPAAGIYYIVAVGRDSEGQVMTTSAAAFEVTATQAVNEPPSVSPRPKVPERAKPPTPDTVGPAVLGAALAVANRTRTVSRKGYVRLFCGRFLEDEVTGACGARSVRSLGAGPLRLRRRAFLARPGRAVRLRFRLTQRSLRALKLARTVRMRGHVAARDQLENRSSATFRFRLAAPGAGPQPSTATDSTAW